MDLSSQLFSSLISSLIFVPNFSDQFYFYFTFKLFHNFILFFAIEPKLWALNSCCVNNCLPPAPKDLTFPFPTRYDSFLVHDSGPGEGRILIFGDNGLVDGLARAEVWLADGTFKVFPHIFFQLYSIHFKFSGGINPAALYCLLPNKTRNTYDRVMNVLKEIVPNASPDVILTDFDFFTLFL